MILKSGRNKRGSRFKTFINDGPVLTLTCFATSQIWPHLFEMLISCQAHTRMCSERSNGHWFYGLKQILGKSLRISSDKASNLPKRDVRFILLK